MIRPLKASTKGPFSGSAMAVPTMMSHHMSRRAQQFPVYSRTKLF